MVNSHQAGGQGVCGSSVLSRKKAGQPAKIPGSNFRKRSFPKIVAAVLILALCVVSLPVEEARAVACSSSGGDWGTDANWVCGHVPTASDDVTIPDGKTVTIASGVSAVANTLTISGGANATSLTLSDASSSLTVTGAVSLDAPTATSVTHSLNVGAGTLDTGSLAITSGSGSTRISEVTISTGTINVAGDVTFGGTSTTAKLTFTSNGTLNLTGNFGGSGTFTAGTGTVNYYGSGAQTIWNFTYNDLTVSNGGTKTPNGPFIVNNTLTVDTGATLDVSTRTLTLPGGATLIVNGTLDFTDSAGKIQSGTTGTTTLTMGASGLIRTMDDQGIGPATGASLQTQTGGVWDVSDISSNGTVEYYRNTTSGQSVTDRDYNNLTVTGSAQTKTWTLGAARAINGSLTINASAPLTLSGAQTVNVGGSWSNSGTFSAGTSTVVFNGSSAQTIGGSSATTFNNLTINNSSGVSLSGVDATVNGALTFSSGRLATGANTLILGASGSVSGAGAGGYVYGRLRKTVPTGAPTIAFEVGDASVYAPISVTFSGVTGGSGTLTGSTTSGQHPNYADSDISSSDYINRYWTLTPSGLTFTSYDATFTFVAGDIVGSPDTSNLVLQKYSSSWSNPVSKSSTSTTVTGNGFTSFSDFASGAGGVPTPVTISYFKVVRRGGNVYFDWSTSTETGNVGFNLYAEAGGGRTRLNAELIPSQKTDSLERLDYTFETNAAGNVFYIEDVSVTGETRRHGPFQIGEEYGERVEEKRIVWDSIPRQPDLQVGATAAGVSLAVIDSDSSGLLLKVNHTGIHRVTYEMLRDAGFDLGGVKPSTIVLSKNGQPVPIFVNARGAFGPGSYIEFFGQALDTLYTDTNVYTLTVNGANVARVRGSNNPPARGVKPAASYTAKLVVNNQRAFAEYAPGNDPWYDTSMLAFTSSKSWDFPFQVDGLVNSSDAALELAVWGVTDWPQNPDHHLTVALNGVPVASEIFDGTTLHTIQINLPNGVLREGENVLQLTLPGDTGVDWDMINLDKFTVTYRRVFRAQVGRLTFAAAGKVFKVTNLPSRNVVVYRLTTSGPVRLGRVQVQAEGGGFSATFAGAPNLAMYLVSTVEAMYSPAFESPRPQADLNRPAEYLIIAHPAFIEGIQPLAQARQAQGLTVNVVDVNDLYAQYTGGVFNPWAIKKYIAYAARNLGTRYVLLVGGDTYDYRNYLGVNSVSFIPSLYVTTGPTVRYVPADPSYADVNNDGIPDLAIGRFPVRTQAELTLMVNKTLAYKGKDYRRTAVFASDRNDGFVSFKNVSEELSGTLPSDWTVESIHLDDLSVSAARTQLLAAMNRGTALVTFTGHSGPVEWTFSQLFNTSYAAGLTNAGRPFVAVQWGCWNNYYVHPTKNFLVQSLLFSGDNGAVATLGASTLTDSESERLLGQLLMPRLTTPGMTIGRALQDAKVELARTHPELLDVLLGWSLMGDPALVIEP